MLDCGVVVDGWRWEIDQRRAVVAKLAAEFGACVARVVAHEWLPEFWLNRRPMDYFARARHSADHFADPLSRDRHFARENDLQIFDGVIGAARLPRENGL